MQKEQKSKSIRIDNDVMKTLSKARQGFESPNDCLKRLLTCDCLQDELNNTQENDDVSEESE